MTQSLYRWRLGCFGEDKGRFYVQEYRHGRARDGQGSSVTRVKRFSSEQQMQDYLAIKHFPE